MELVSDHTILLLNIKNQINDEDNWKHVTRLAKIEYMLIFFGSHF